MWKLMLAVVVMAAGLGGCVAYRAEPEGVEISAAQYGEAFEAARAVLREKRYLLDRVDAPQGILTTIARSDPGLARAWDAPPGLDQAAENLLQRQQRIVRISFVPRGQSGERFPATDPGRDFVYEPVDTVMRVRVAVERIERPGQRVSVDAVHLATQTTDPELERAGMMPRYVVGVRDDGALAGELQRLILGRMGKR